MTDETQLLDELRLLDAMQAPDVTPAVLARIASFEPNGATRSCHAPARAGAAHWWSFPLAGGLVFGLALISGTPALSARHGLSSPMSIGDMPLDLLQAVVVLTTVGLYSAALWFHVWQNSPAAGRAIRGE